MAMRTFERVIEFATCPLARTAFLKRHAVSCCSFTYARRPDVTVYYTGTGYHEVVCKSEGITHDEVQAVPGSGLYLGASDIHPCMCILVSFVCLCALLSALPYYARLSSRCPRPEPVLVFYDLLP